MLFPSFGLKIAQELLPVKQLMAAMRGTDKLTLDSFESQLLLRDLYETNFRIANHADPNRPMSLVAKQPKETLGPYSRERRLFHRFASLGVGELFKISVTEFLNQPRERVEMMFEIAEEKAAADARENSHVQRKLDDAVRANGGPVGPR